MQLKKILIYVLILSFALTSCAISLEQTPPPIDGAVTTLSEALSIPVTWSALHLTGHIIYIFLDPSNVSATPAIRSLDLTTGKITTLFQVSSGGWIYYLSAAPDRKTLLISYIPPAEGSSSSSQALYTLPTDGSREPQLLLATATPSDQYIQAEWSPDGQFIYYVHVNQKLPLEMGQMTPVYTLLRIRYPDGAPEKIAEHAFWPRVAPDSSRIVYISSDPFKSENNLFVANLDGSAAHQIMLSSSAESTIKDAPLFLPDGQSLLYSAPVAGEAYHRNWFDQLTGVQIAKAHSDSSGWWMVPEAGGTPSRFTNISDVNLFASVSPDQHYIASLGASGLSVMGVDGSNVTQIIKSQGMFGSIVWIP